ncbi:MAG: tetratricopeptide repeat protein [bacterium]
MDRTERKLVTVTLTLNDINKDRFFFGLPEKISDTEKIIEKLQEKYQTSIGTLKIEEIKNRFVLTWSPENVDKRAETLHLEALEFSKSNKKNKAIDLWRKALSINENDVEYLYKLSLILFEEKKYSETIDVLKKLVSICPIHYKGNLLLGIILIKSRNFNEAADYLIASQRLNKSDVLSYLNLGAVYSIKKEFKKAINMFNKVIQINDKECRAYLGLSKIYTMLNDVDTSNKYLHKIIETSSDTKMVNYAKRSIKTEIIEKPEYSEYQEINVDHIEDYISRGIRNYLSGNYNHAQKLYENYLQKKPNDDYIWYLLGETQLREGKIDAASDCFKRAIRLNNKRQIYYKSLSIAFHFLNKPNDVIAVQKKYPRHDEDPVSITILGISYLKINDFNNAIKYLKNSLNIYRNNPLATYYLAYAYIKINNNKAAIKILKDIKRYNLHIPIKARINKLSSKLG